MHHKRGRRASVEAARANFKALGKRVVRLHPGNGDRGRERGKQIQVDIREKGGEPT